MSFKIAANRGLDIAVFCQFLFGARLLPEFGTLIVDIACWQFTFYRIRREGRK